MDTTGFETPSYEALSYTWGSIAKNKETVFVLNTSEGGECSEFLTTALEIGPNLACALRYLRYLDKRRTLWIDAICINQEDIDERDSQVNRMGTIYESADRVVVFLGPEDHHKLALSTLQYLGSQLEPSRGNEYAPSPDCTEPTWWQPKVELPYNITTWEAIELVMEYAWLDRLWVIQEIQLGNSKSILTCGHDEIPWYLFRRAVIALLNRKGAPPTLLSLIFNVAPLCWNQRSQNLPQLLQMCSRFKCGVPSDKIYGILGLAPPKLACSINSDYRISADEVFKRSLLIHLDIVG